MNKIFLALALGWVGGFVDSLGYLTLSHVFTAHMSGNAAAVGAQIGRGDLNDALTAGAVIPGFFLGVCLGAVSEAVASQYKSRRPLFFGLAWEIALLLAFMLIDRGDVSRNTPRFFVLAEFLAMSMGLQSATLRRAGHMKVNTTYVTGMLANTAEESMRYVFSWRKRGGDAEKTRREAAWYGRVYGGIFVAFMLGGICGGLGHTLWGARALCIPTAVLVVLAWRSPH